MSCAPLCLRVKGNTLIVRGPNELQKLRRQHLGEV
jgi:hypothetical protein